MVFIPAVGFGTDPLLAEPVGSHLAFQVFLPLPIQGWPHRLCQRPPAIHGAHAFLLGCAQLLTVWAWWCAWKDSPKQGWQQNFCPSIQVISAHKCHRTWDFSRAHRSLWWCTPTFLQEVRGVTSHSKGGSPGLQGMAWQHQVPSLYWEWRVPGIPPGWDSFPLDMSHQGLHCICPQAQVQRKHGEGPHPSNGVNLLYMCRAVCFFFFWQSWTVLIAGVNMQQSVFVWYVLASGAALLNCKWRLFPWLQIMA